jgi:hypothetical protein
MNLCWKARLPTRYLNGMKYLPNCSTCDVALDGIGGAGSLRLWYSLAALRPYSTCGDGHEGPHTRRRVTRLSTCSADIAEDEALRSLTIYRVQLAIHPFRLQHMQIQYMQQLEDLAARLRSTRCYFQREVWHYRCGKLKMVNLRMAGM